MNYAARNATVRYDETLLEVAEIKILVHQRGQQSAGESQAKAVGEDKPEQKPGVKQMSGAAPATVSPPKPAMPKSASVAPNITPKPPASGDGQPGKEPPPTPHQHQ